ncbi:FAD:protein FMN transferase [Collinsella stercoris]|uniref:FAD:protein FMN transferase n=1 Tax=Collinsella stercoris TaxID=147206 RepID=UPI003AF09854
MGSTSGNLSRRSLCAGAISLLPAAAALLSAPLLSGCANTPATQQSSDAGSEPSTGSTFAFDTYCTFTVYGDGSAPALLAKECARYDKLFNLYDERSDIARINAASGEPVRVHADTVDLLLAAKTYCEQADGLFDITIGAVSTLWDFTEGVRPTPEAIADALPHVDWRCIEIDEEALTVRLADPQAKLDLGGIAKGYVADRLCDLLRDETSATGAVLSLGGNIALFGEKPNDEPWETGIRDPNDPGGDTVVGTARVQGGSLVTSGLYERMFEQDGVTYWHILDPRTGEPVQTDVASVTVLCPSSTTADALSTTLFVAGSRRGAEIADALEDTAAYFILQDGRAVESTRWQELTDFS